MDGRRPRRPPRTHGQCRSVPPRRARASRHRGKGINPARRKRWTAGDPVFAHGDRRRGIFTGVRSVAHRFYRGAPRAHDAQHAPRVGAREVDSRTRLLEQLFVFGDGCCVADGIVDEARRAGSSSVLLRRRRASRLEVSFFGSLLESLESFLLGGRHHFGIELLATGGARFRRSRRSRRASA